jgi:hypothetical protein
VAAGGAGADVSPAGPHAEGHGDGHTGGHAIHMPSPSYFPVVAALGLPVIGYGLIFAMPAVIVVGAAITLAGFFGWALEPSAE